MKNSYAIIASVLMLVFTACKKSELDIPVVERPIAIQAQVPQKVYTNLIYIDLDARTTVSSNGLRQLNFLWSSTAFPAGHPPVIASPSEALTKVDSLFAGKYLFKLKVWDNMGNQAIAEYQLEVIQDTLQSAPKISPLPDIVLQFPQNTINLNGTDNYKVNPAGRELSFFWTVIETPANSATIVINQYESPNAYAQVTTPGHYRFSLELTNELGFTSADTIDVNVLADPLSGTERIYENLTWKVEDNGWGFYAQLFINEKDIFIYRNILNTSVSVWDEEKQDWVSPDRYEWYGGDDGLSIMVFDNPGPFDGKKTRVKVKFL